MVGGPGIYDPGFGRGPIAGGPVVGGISHGIVAQQQQQEVGY